MKNDIHTADVKHPYFGVGIGQWASNLARYGVDKRQIQKYKKITQFSLKLAPFVVKERFQYGSLIEKTSITKPPVFVIGHWRSGTTHLQNILTQDPQWGYLNTIQSVFPNVFLNLEERLSKLLPEQKRLMDNVKLSADTPSEEEIALATVCKASFWQGYFFTDEMDYYFNKYVLFEGISQRELKRWKEGYVSLLKKLTYRYDGKQLLLKNPPNTARVKFLLEMFPDAKFIHICRNPYDVFQSRIKQYDSAVRMKDLQNLTKDQWTEKSIRYYKLMMDKYCVERALIPEGNLVEVSFENLRSDPLSVTESIYTQLGLTGYKEALVNFEQYIASLGSYQQNKYSYSQDTLLTVRNNWHRYGKSFGYDMDVAAREDSAEVINMAKEG